MDLSGYPKLINAETKSAAPVKGRIFTIGSSAECHLQVPDRSFPRIAAHLLFKNGGYSLQSLTDSIATAINKAPCASPQELHHGDSITIGTITLIFAEKEYVKTSSTAPILPAANKISDPALLDLVNAIVKLLRNSNEEVFSDLVSGFSRIMRSDASRLVEENENTGERKTIARYPGQSGLDRFSNRAIDWAKSAAQTVIMHDTEWNVPGDPAHSLEKNLVGSILCAPLREGDKTLGYLYLDRLQGNLPFTEEDRSFCDALLPLFSEILSNHHERRRQRETIMRLQEQQLTPSGGMIYESRPMTEVMTLAAKAARTDAPILVLGETGTGKELMARFIHNSSPRADKPFKAINCGALPEQLIESELFGHEKGSFTGAISRKIGLFESANHGTVFLDEIGDMPLHLQVRLLRVLQEGECTRVGATDSIPIDARIIAATNKNLETEIAAGKFRQDLYFRLNVLTVLLPPLRDRGPDITLLAEYLIKKYCQQFGFPLKTLSAAARNTLSIHTWPGNVRELENVLQKTILVSESNRIDPADIAFQQSSSTATGPVIPFESTLRDAREHAERHAIENALAKTGGNVSLASKNLAIDRKWLIKKMEDFGIDADVYRKQ